MQDGDELAGSLGIENREPVPDDGERRRCFSLFVFVVCPSWGVRPGYFAVTRMENFSDAVTTSASSAGHSTSPRSNSRTRADNFVESTFG